jgi:hypothetical protein
MTPCPVWGRFSPEAQTIPSGDGPEDMLAVAHVLAQSLDELSTFSHVPGSKQFPSASSTKGGEGHLHV